MAHMGGQQGFQRAHVRQPLPGGLPRPGHGGVGFGLRLGPGLCRRFRLFPPARAGSGAQGGQAVLMQGPFLPRLPQQGARGLHRGRLRAAGVQQGRKALPVRRVNPGVLHVRCQPLAGQRAVALRHAEQVFHKDMRRLVRDAGQIRALEQPDDRAPFRPERHRPARGGGKIDAAAGSGYGGVVCGALPQLPALARECCVRGSACGMIETRAFPKRFFLFIVFFTHSPRRRDGIEIPLRGKFQTHHHTPLRRHGAGNKVVFPAVAVHVVDGIHPRKNKTDKGPRIGKPQSAKLLAVPVLNMPQAGVVQHDGARLVQPEPGGDVRRDASHFTPVVGVGARGGGLLLVQRRIGLTELDKIGLGNYLVSSGVV